MKPAKDNRVRIGWFDLTQSQIEADEPATGYAVSLVGTNTLARIARANWIDAISRGLCVVNEACEQTACASPLASNGSELRVNWPDAKSPHDVACSLVEAREIVAAKLANHGAARFALIDATALNKSLLAALIGMFIRTRTVDGIDLIYQQGDYRYEGQELEKVYANGPLSHIINDIEFSISAVPYVEGKYKAGIRRHLVLLCGLDFQRVMEKVRELEPARIDVVIESEALEHEQSARAFYSLCRRLEIPQDRVAQSQRSDVKKVLALVGAAIAREAESDLHTIFVSSGSKPFTIAATLHSVLQSECPMLSTIPDRVVSLDRSASGPMRLFRLTDRTAIT